MGFPFSLASVAALHPDVLLVYHLALFILILVLVQHIDDFVPHHLFH